MDSARIVSLRASSASGKRLLGSLASVQELQREPSTNCPKTPRVRRPQVTDSVRYFSTRFACPQTISFWASPACELLTLKMLHLRASNLEGFWARPPVFLLIRLVRTSAISHHRGLSITQLSNCEPSVPIQNCVMDLRFSLHVRATLYSLAPRTRKPYCPFDLC